MFNPSPWRQNQPQNQNVIMIDSDSDENDDEGGAGQMPVEFAGAAGQHPQPGMAELNRRYNIPPHEPNPHNQHRHSHGPSSLTYQPPLSHEQEKKLRSRLREERHAALCVLMDRELLTIQALAAQETLPQTRRRFLSKLLAPEDPDVAAAIRADQFTVTVPRPLSASTHPGSSVDHSSSYAQVTTVSRRLVDVCETGDGGWYQDEGDGSGGGSGSNLSSPASSAKIRGRGTPERTRAKGRVPSGRHTGYQARERRRRWSGAERQDHGVSMMPP
ncbi:uncharacterized protein BJX67DRAFT_340141 [Aspergillus lucknowensis]|uniref:Uncharacterized protein n=1 Tax=Aspergillus lucknowensis TaxID=176173 RepID=A0ABR4M7X5_9EURO